MKKPTNIVLVTATMDKASGMYGAPITVQTEALAQRQFMMSLAKLPPYVRADYSLWQLGTYELETGKLYPKLKRIDTILPDFENDPMFHMPDNVKQFLQEKKDESK